MAEPQQRLDDPGFDPATIESYRQAFQFSPDAITVTELSTGRYVDVNAGFEVLFGLSRSEVLGHCSSEFSIWADPTERARLVDRIAKDGSLRDFLAVGRHRDGSLRTCSLNASTVGDGTNRQLVLVIRDLTEQLRTERALREAAERFSKAFHGSPDAVILSKLETGVVLEVNDGFCRLSGHPREEVVGKSTTEIGLLQAEDRVALVAELKSLGRLSRYEVQMRSREGDVALVELSSEIIELDGAPCLMTTGRDITRQRMAEREKSNLEMQLRRTQKLESLGTLAGGIAHDFNNILTAVLAHADLAKLDVEDPAVTIKHIDEVKKAGIRAQELVRRIVTFSRQQKQESRPVDLQGVVRETLALLRSIIPSTIHITESYLAEPQVVLGDHGQLCQVVMNLCTNASYAMGTSPGTLDVRLEQSNPPGLGDAAPASVCITISDTGHGMAPEVLKRMFEPFFTTKPPGEGTGLGLSVVHGIVHDHCGFVDAASEKGKGSRFRVFLPLHRAALPKPAPQLEALPRGNGERILFLDDEEAICKLAMQLLTRLGYRVTTYCNPVDALAHFTGGQMDFDLVITDLTMPRMTGIEVATRLLARQPALPIILTSGFGGEWTQEEVRAHGLLELVPKPLTLTSLAAAARRGVEAIRDPASDPPRSPDSD
jgi:PAS domain S-box-containing protein